MNENEEGGGGGGGCRVRAGGRVENESKAEALTEKVSRKGKVICAKLGFSREAA